MITTKLRLTFTGLLFISFLNWQCTKIDTTTIGGGLIPVVDNVNTFELILPVVANNFDSVAQNKECAIIYPGADHVLGTITNDPYFGSTKATIFTELKPVNYPFYFSGTTANRTLDSVVLVLNYTGTYGDTTVAQGIEVYEISGSKFNPDSSSCTTYPTKNLLLGSSTYTPKNLNDSVFLFKERTTNQLRIKLTNAFGQLLLSQDSASATYAFRTDSAMKVFFKGFGIIPTGSGNALNYFNLIGANTKLSVYYKFKPTPTTDSTVVDNFRFTFLSKSANNIVRNRTGSEIALNVAHPPAGNNNIYIQTTPGSYAEIKIPGLRTLSNRIVHRAELIMEQVYSASTLDNYFIPPSYLFLDLKDSINGSKYRPIPCDFTTPSGQPDLATFGGFRTTIKDPLSGNSIARYSFNISRYIQKIITNRRGDSILRLRAPDYIITPGNYIDDCGLPVFPLNFGINQTASGRVKLGGGSNPNYRMRLRLIYSNL